MTTNEQGNKNKWIWIGLGAALLFCCCAVLVAFFVFRQAGQKIKDGVKTDPAAASQAAHKIVDYDLPPGYQEQMSMDILFYSFVTIAPTTSSSTRGTVIMLAQFNQPGVDQKQMEEQIRRSFEQQSGNSQTNMKVVKVEKKTIRGDEVEVAIYEGADQNGLTMRQLITAFPGKAGTAMLMILGSAQEWDQKLVDDFIESIH